MSTGQGAVAVLCGWEGNAGLPSHQPSVTDSVGLVYPYTDIVAPKMDRGTSPTLLCTVGIRSMASFMVKLLEHTYSKPFSCTFSFGVYFRWPNFINVFTV